MEACLELRGGSGKGGGGGGKGGGVGKAEVAVTYAGVQWVLSGDGQTVRAVPERHSPTTSAGVRAACRFAPSGHAAWVPPYAAWRRLPCSAQPDLPAGPRLERDRLTACRPSASRRGHVLSPHLVHTKQACLIPCCCLYLSSLPSRPQVDQASAADVAAQLAALLQPPEPAAAAAKAEGGGGDGDGEGAFAARVRAALQGLEPAAAAAKSSCPESSCPEQSIVPSGSDGSAGAPDGAPAAGGAAAAAAAGGGDARSGDADALPEYLRMAEVAASWQPPASFLEQLCLAGLQTRGAVQQLLGGAEAVQESARKIACSARLAAYYVSRRSPTTLHDAAGARLGHNQGPLWMLNALPWGLRSDVLQAFRRPAL